MLKYVKVTPDYAVKRGRKWFEPSCFARDDSERMLAEATFKFYGVVCSSQSEVDEHIDTMKRKAEEFLEKAKSSSRHPERYAMFDITEKVTDIPSTWTVERAISELGGAQLKAYLDETGLAGQIDLARIIASDMSR